MSETDRVLDALPEWSLCIATLNRQDALLQTLSCALDQTCPPAEIIVVDVSDDWQDSEAKARNLVAGQSMALHYQTLDVRSITVQRNVGIARCSKDVIFLIDDDSFMFPDCAEEILQIYAADPDHAVSAVAATLVPELPQQATEQLMPERFHTAHAGNVARGSLRGLLLNSSFGQWFTRKILFQSKDEIFIKYEGPRDTPVPETIATRFDVVPVAFMPGSAMTVRRDVVIAEPFDTALRYYAASEDIDATYRFGRHGRVLQANKARLHHYKAAGGRIRRRAVMALQLLNMAIFIKRNAADPDQFRGAYRQNLHRRLLSEFLKDLLSGRFRFPQLRGVLEANRQWHHVWARDIEELEVWYPELQRRILDEG
ncbi:glycosyltransferase [Jannaschia sp. CCS1]|uniref:glycosyltransferase n=1 Tax=Jannaschia sp. (strain CCS1) TaxID=290400 RepID=UPI000053D79B|nr:glycosyltransferase family 2 protein [Jannaschia sp. CCS1]ABD57186.1 glycosyl transferase family 2 [Jannaschia sp. CCS1]